MPDIRVTGGSLPTPAVALGTERFDLKAKNHQIVGSSQNYKSRSGRNNGIGAVARAAIGARIIDLT